MSEYFVYIVACSDGSLYTGYCRDLDERIQKHNSGLGAKYTRGRKPVQLVYSESFVNRSEAMKREAAIKKLSLLQKRKLFANN